MKQIWEQIQKMPIYELMFLFFVFSIPFQLRIILNSDAAYIDYYFSYHLGIYIYLSDLLFFGFLIAYALFNKERKPAFWLVLSPIIWATINVFHVERWDLYLYNIFKITQFWAIIAFLALNKRIHKPVITVLFAAAFLQAMTGIWQFHVQHPVGLDILGEYFPKSTQTGASTIDTADGKLVRAYGTMTHPNLYGGFLAIILTLWLHVSRETKGLKNWPYVSCGTFVLLWGLTVSFSRSAWLAAIIGISAIITVFLFQKYQKTAIFLGFLAIVSCGTMLGLYSDYILSRTDTQNSSPALTYRADFNKLAIDVFNLHPLTGMGAGQYIPTLQNTQNLEPWQYQPPHNVFLMFLVELGIIGLFISFFSVWQMGFTWNNMHGIGAILVLVLLPLILLDHYLLTIQSGLLIFAIALGILIGNKKDVSQVRETSN